MTDDISTRIAQIEARVAAARPPEDRPLRQDMIEVSVMRYRHDELHAHADLIAHAPEDLAYLLAEVKRLRGCVKRVEEVLTFDQRYYGSGGLLSYTREVLAGRDPYADAIEQAQSEGGPDE